MRTSTSALLCQLALATTGCFAVPEFRGLTDATVFVQDVHSTRTRPSPEKASKAMLTKIRPQVRSIVDGIFKRATSKLNLQIPQILFTDLKGKLTQWIMAQYGKEKLPAVREALDGVIDMVTPVLTGDITKMTDEQLAAKLINWDKIEPMVHKYLGATNAAPAVSKLVETAVSSVKSSKAMDPESAAKMLIEATNQTLGAPVADFMSYLQSVAKKQVELDPAKAMDMISPILTQAGAPPAITEFVADSAEITRSHKVVEQPKESERLMRALAKAAEQLKMPGSLSEVANFAGDMWAANKVPDAAAVARFYGIAARLNDELEGPHSISEALQYNAQAAKDGTPADQSKINEMMVKVVSELGLVPAASELLSFALSDSASKVAQDKAIQRHLFDIGIKLAEQLELPAPVSKYFKDMEALMDKGQLTDQKAFKGEVQMLRKLGATNLADILGHLQGPLLNGKQPDALALAAIAPSLMKVPDDLEKTNAVLASAKEKLLTPLKPFHEKVVAKVTGGMPESFLKNSVKRALSA